MLAQNTYWHPEIGIDANVDWPPFQIFFANIVNYVPRGINEAQPREALALFGVIDMFHTKFQALVTGGTWTRIPDFSTPDLEGTVAILSDNDADDYDMDIIGEFFESWGFKPVLMDLDMQPQADEPAIEQFNP